MQLTWYGSSCFLLKTDMGKIILFDPLEYLNDHFSNIPTFDIMTLSHTYFKINHSKSNYDNCTVIDRPGTFNIDNITIEGFSSYQDTLNGLKRGKNIIYVITVDNFRICHLGHLGHLLETDIIEKLNNIDILITPLDSNFSLSGDIAAKLCSILLPKYIIPMNFSTDCDSYSSNDFRRFISLINNINKLNLCTIDLNSLNSNEYCTCLILTPKQDK